MRPQYLYTMMMMLTLPCWLYGQEQPNLRQRAEEHYLKYEYSHAIALYLNLVDGRKPRLRDLERLAVCYKKLNDYESAENWYARVVQHEDSDAENLIRYGDVLKSNGKYDVAKKQLEAYAAETGDWESVAIQLAGCDSAVVWMANPTPHKLRNEANVNTALSEFSIFPLGDKAYYVGEPDALVGQRLYGWTGNAFLRVYTVDVASDHTLSHPSIAESPINNERFHIGPVAVDAGGNTLYVTRTYPGHDGEYVREGKKKIITNRLELYIHTHQGGTWQVEPFAYNDVSMYSVGHATLSSDGQTLYFVSDMPGGHGGTDIWYYVEEADNRWGKPMNAGPIVNSPGDELFPNIGPDGALYYSSDGLAGMGGLDVFKSLGSESTWSKPENLRYPVNSAGDDFAYIVSTENEGGLAGFLSSNRKGGVGNDDIYSFSYEKPRIVIVLNGTTSDKSTGERISSTSVTLYDGTREIVAKKNSDKMGRFEFILDSDMGYTVLGQQEGYHADSAKIRTHGITTSDTLEVALLLEPVSKIGQTFELEHIYYDFDKDNIRPDAAAILDELVRTMRDNPTLKIELASHTDSRGSDAYNMDLSQRRAQSAVNYLVSRGISRERMVAQGYGETRLVNHCSNGVPCSRAAHQANRRTEVTVLAY
ncbi:OmpA family protein [Parapedobacter tibetensis]|uniref:OmpA family protein n=1 Tax=Parapedobacter tibetensis TaxID=2972951 RepID=UPI00214DAE14|nr:OmpA family protein [Parapedobacter tibetensis]